jgi:hypothetical protein
MQEGVMRHALAGIIIAASLATPIGASAVQPNRIEFEFDRVVFAPATSAACGFAVYHHDVGTGRIVLFSDAGGVVVRELDQELSTSTWFSADTGRSFTFPNPARLPTFSEGNDVGDAALAILTGLETAAPGTVIAGQVIIPSVVTGIGPFGIPDVDQVAAATRHGTFPGADELIAARCAALAS